MMCHHLPVFWHCRDLQLFADLGILSADFLRQKYDDRQVIDKTSDFKYLAS